MERVENLVRLILARGIGAVTINRLMERFGDAAGILGASESEIKRVDGVTSRHAKAVREAREIDPRPEVDQAAEAGVKLIAYDDPSYPKALKQIHDPPPLLYVRGSLEPDDAVAAAIVGTRRASRYGREQAEYFGTALARTGVVVVSGLARGIDTCAHRGCLAAGGRTLAVIGCGLARMYPPENRDLAVEIAGQGAVISEFPMNTKPDSSNFPRRNRIIAGLSLGVIVIEAPERSGALITARQAAEAGREVFALPGRIDQESSAGCHYLIRNGAVLVRKIDDVLEEFGELASHLNAEPDATAPLRDRKATVSSGKADAVPEATDQESVILGALSGDAVHIDQVCASTGLPVHQVSATLMMLELKRQVRQEPGKFFVRR